MCLKYLKKNIPNVYNLKDKDMFLFDSFLFFVFSTCILKERHIYL